MSQEKESSTRPGTAGSDSTKTHALPESQDSTRLGVPEKEQLHGGEGESAIPEDKKARTVPEPVWRLQWMLIRSQEDLIENHEDNWEHDPRNPRNWPFWKKWRMAGIVGGILTVV